MRFSVPQCIAAPQNFQRIVGLSLGLLGLYRGDALIAIDVSPDEKENPQGTYDRSGRMLVGCFVRWCNCTGHADHRRPTC